MDAFRTLTGGSNFDRKRFKGDINHFQPLINQTTSSSAAVPAELDFFATPTTATEEETTSNTQEKKKKEKKRKRTSTIVTDKPSTGPEIDVAARIRKHRIKLTGLDLPSPLPSLSSLSTQLSTPEQLESLRLLEKNWKEELGEEKEPSGIQMASWGVMLAGRDILACAPTGSGKTFSFILPLLALNPPSSSTSSTSTTSTTSSVEGEKEKETSLRPRAIVIEPTRELAMQVLRETRRLTRDGAWRVGVLGEEGVGSVKKEGGKQLKKGKGKKGKGKETEKDATVVEEPETEEKEDDKEEKETETEEVYLGPIDILITTPLRLVYALKSSLVSLSSLSHLILDEADKLFELNFLEQTDEILASCPQGTRKGMFSATMPSSIEEMAKTVMAGAGSGLVRAIVGHKEAATSTITQELQFVNTEDHKLLSLRSLITLGQFTPPVLIFVQSITRAKELTTELLLDGLSTDCIHAERTGEERDLAVKEFAEGKTWCLICTDVMGRGIDFKGVKLVVNYDFPQSAMSYIHRIGRTGRAGNEGKAITFFTKADAGHLKTIVNVMRQSGCPVPDWMVALPNPSQDSKKALKMKPIGRKDISRTNGAGTAGEGGRRDKGVKRERIMGGKGGVFKRRDGEEEDVKKKGKKAKGDKVKERKNEEGEERQSKKPRKGKVDMDE